MKLATGLLASLAFSCAFALPTAQVRAQVPGQNAPIKYEFPCVSGFVNALKEPMARRKRVFATPGEDPT
jgi:hypothetical protein